MTFKPPLSVTHPELAKQAVGWDPSTLTHGSHQKREWMCELGHLFESAISKRSMGQGCSVCAGKTILVGFNDLQTNNPELAVQAYGWDPTTITRSAAAMKEWQCLYGHVWKATVSNRGTGTGCPTCSGKIVLAGFNDLATVEPEIANEAFGWDPTTVTRGAAAMKEWRCPLGHEWAMTVNARSSGHGCPTCANQRILAGFNDLATMEPEIAKQAFGWDPTTVFSRSGARKTWKCQRGHEWVSTVGHRTAGTGCPICSGRTPLAGFNDLTTVEPGIAEQAFGWDPTTVTRSAGAKKDWRCERGHTWSAKVASRSKGNGCPVCSGKTVLVGFNDLATLEPEIAEQAFGWDPTTVTRRAGGKREWKCEIGHRWSALIQNRSSGSGCPTCADYGFDPNAKAWIYFLTHPQWQMLQIGITNFPDQRLGNHKKLGWEIIELRGPMEGLIAREWETSILQMLKRHGAKLAPEEVAGKFDGYTEAWLTKSFQVKSLRELMDEVERDEV